MVAPELREQKPRVNKQTKGRAASYKHHCLLKTLHNYCWLNDSLSLPDLNPALLSSPSSAKEENVK